MEKQGYRMCGRVIVAVVGVILFLAGPVRAAVPSQFVAKMYSEALGRAPDVAGWQYYTNYFLSSGCSQNTLSTIARNFFDSAEYASKGYTPQEAVLTVYRAVLSREPDSVGFSYYVRKMQIGWTPGMVASNQAASPEFAGIVSSICSGGAYRQDWGTSQAINIGAWPWTQSQLESCVNNNVVCSVPERVVVYLTSTLLIPAGHVLETSGTPSRTLYAKQARIVRNSGAFGHMLLLGAGATIRNIWISGQRHLYKSVPTVDGVRANIRYEGGAGAVIKENRLDFPYQRTHIETHSADGSITIEDNLMVGYTGNHTNDGTQTWVSDGVSNHCRNATIRNNDIIDPTDVGIVIFGHTPDGVQMSTAFSNTIVHAGLSAYGSLVFDTTADNCMGCLFSGAGMYGNLILAGRTVHSDIMLSVGTGPWRTPDCRPGGSGCGSGAKMNDNYTIWGDDKQKVKVQHSIVVDGMLNADDLGNGLYVEPLPLGTCYHGTGVRNDLPDHASGSLMLEDEDIGPVHSCIGH